MRAFRSLYVASCALATLGLVGCASNPDGAILDSGVQIPRPINVEQRGIDSLLYLGAEAQIVGSPLGGHHDGWLKIRQSTIYGNGELKRVWEGWMRDVGVQMLEVAGYEVRTPSELFSRVESYGGVRFVLAGRVGGLGYNTYGALAGDKTTVSMDVRWELLDAATQNVLYSTTTSASSETGGQTGDAIIVAFRRLFASLLGSREFVEAFPTGGAIAPSGGIAPVLVAADWPTAMPAAADLIYITEEDARPSDRSTVFERVAESVVSIFGPTGRGSAFIISRDGLALTNHHVIEDQAWLAATTRDNDTLAVRLVRSDADADVALVQVMCEPDCITVELSRSVPQVGSDLLVVGSPVGLNYTYTRGIVSGLRLSDGVTQIQTDAAINPGNSGGPMLAPDGTVIGIVSSKLVGPDIEGLGFGIEIGDALRSVGIRH